MAVQANPKFEDAYINLANCYGMLKNYDKTIETLNKVLAINPSNKLALTNLAVTYDFMGNKEKAKEYRERANRIPGK